MLPSIYGPSGTSRKTNICRYFVTSGTCFYGDECQFLHTKLNPSVLPTEIGLTEGQTTSIRDLTLTRLAEESSNPVTSMDPLFQAFAPTAGLPPESKLQTYMNVHTTPCKLSPSVEKPRCFESVSPILHSTSVTNAMANLAIETLGKTPNPGAAEFVPMSSVMRPPQGSIPHSMSAIPYLFHYPLSTAGVTASTPFGRFDVAQCHSPGMSPNHSPLVNRKSQSPLTTPLVGDLALSDAHSTTQDQFLSSGTIYQQESVGGTTYFFTAEETGGSSKESPAPVVVPDFALYSGNSVHTEHMKPKTIDSSFFLSDELRMDIQHRQSLTLAQVNPNLHSDLPAEVDNYHNLSPLEAIINGSSRKSVTFRLHTTVYKARNVKTGVYYCLRRIQGFQLTNTKCMTVVEAWKKVQHSNLVHLRDVFTTKAFGDHSVVFVFDYHPGATTLMNQYFSQPELTAINGYPPAVFSNGEGITRHYSHTKGSLRQHSGLLPESQIWAYIVQLSSALRTIHAAGLACRTFEPTKILITGKSRLQLNCCGIFDVLSYEASQQNFKAHMHHFQQEDLLAFGKVVLALTCSSLIAVQQENLQASMELVSRNYSADLRNLLMYLLSSQNHTCSINEIMPMIGARFYSQLDAVQMRSDMLENELAGEVENGRLVRLLMKLGAINERPEFHMDPTWAETGDRYMLKLFRDYVFHQVMEDGQPWIDMAHIVQCLNKLDSGAHDKICLTSRDEQNILVLSYAELKQCFESSFNELLLAATAPKDHVHI
ncbi:PAN2-PAN3 deadenylation complex subunit pan3-like isoform X2 [Tachypleus tridentatus]|uniref:PAN2-PAN3 deadenylation complex subunit pan3-like isoform X2 n=1 Tax=Tachypleus tridentatus TaxID=6853 RepID=UPI003FD5701F